MKELIVHILGVFIFVPLVVFFASFFLSSLWTRSPRQSTRLAADVSTIFFIVSAYFLLKTMTGFNLLFVIFLLLLLIFGGISYFYWKKDQTLELANIFKIFWRMSFLLFSIAYFCLMIFGIVTSAFQFVK